MEKSKPMADKVECSWKVHPYYKYIMGALSMSSLPAGCPNAVKP